MILRQAKIFGVGAELEAGRTENVIAGAKPRREIRQGLFGTCFATERA